MTKMEQEGSVLKETLLLEFQHSLIVLERVGNVSPLKGVC